METTDKFGQLMLEGYFGKDAGIQAPSGFLALLLQLLSSLAGGCMPKPALAMAKTRSWGVMGRCKRHARQYQRQTGEHIDPDKFANAVMYLADNVSETEAEAFHAENAKDMV